MIPARQSNICGVWTWPLSWIFTFCEKTSALVQSAPARPALFNCHKYFSLLTRVEPADYEKYFYNNKTLNDFSHRLLAD